MILIFILLWVDGLWGMEQETPVQKELSPILSLKEIAVRAVCSHLVDKKISVDHVKQKLNKDCQTLLMESSEPKVLIDKDRGYLRVSTITPDHRYLLVKKVEDSQSRILRLDLLSDKEIVVSDSKENILAADISPSGNLVALLSAEKIWIKDVARNEVIKKAIFNYFRNNDLCNAVRLRFLGEKNLLIFNRKYIDCLSIDKELEPQGYIEEIYVGRLPIAQEYITYIQGALSITKDPSGVLTKRVTFSRITVDGKVKNSTTIKGSGYSIMWGGYPVIYEPDMLIAYDQIRSDLENEGWKEDIDIISLKGWPEVVGPVKQLKCELLISVLAFAHKGQWLIVAGKSRNKNRNNRKKYVTIWDWKSNKQLGTYKFPYPISDVYYTDHPTPYPCLIESSDAIYSFDPIKAVAAGMLSQAAAQKAAATVNNKNSNNNNNVGNDNEPKPTTSRKTTQKNSSARRHTESEK